MPADLLEGPTGRRRELFTGLIADRGQVVAFEPAGPGATLRVRSRLAGELAVGDSVAVAGVCLTVTDVDGESFAAQAVRETLERSTLGALQAGGEVNLELPVRAGAFLGGHIVQGHVDGCGTVREVAADGAGRVLVIDVDDRLARYLVEKGSVAVDGVSLTVSALNDGGFSVALIPETLRQTTLGRLQPRGRVNLEVDILAKHLERLLPVARP